MAGVKSKARALATALALLALPLSGCGGSGPQRAAESTTRAVYDDDVAGVTRNFDDTLKRKVNRSTVGTISDKMHKLGGYRGLTYVNTNAAKHEYTYRADFDRGSMTVVMRLDPDGRVAAYRVFALSD